MLNVVLFGPPGVGKGTQAELLAGRYQLVHISTGELLRSGQEKLPPDERRAVERINGGNLVPDRLAIALINQQIEGACRDRQGLLFDGFPRTAPQAQELDRLLSAQGMPIALMLALQGEQPELVKRLLKRGLTSGRADDQDEEIILRRFEIYGQTAPMVAQHYQRQGKHFAVDGMGPEGEVFARICAVIDAAYPQPLEQTPARHGRL